MKISPKVMIYTAIISIVLIVISIVIQRNAINAQPTLQVYKAADNITAGTVVSLKDLKPVQIYLNQKDSTYISDSAFAVGKVTRENIYKGEFVSTNRLSDCKNTEIFTKEGKQRFSIPANSIDDPYSLIVKKGDMVDIIFTNTSNNQSKDKVGKKSEIVLSKVLVVGAVDKLGKFITNGQTAANAIVFDASQSDILKITQCQYNGKFRFSKYSDADKSKILANKANNNQNEEPSSNLNVQSSSSATEDTSSSDANKNDVKASKVTVAKENANYQGETSSTSQER